MAVCLPTSASQTDRFAVFRLIEKICCLRYISIGEPELNQYEVKFL
jgi:hypothetical protein